MKWLHGRWAVTDQLAEIVRGVLPSKGGGRKPGLRKLAVDVNVRIGFSAPVLERGIRAWHL